MDANIINARQLNRNQQPFCSGSNEVQFRKKVFSLRQAINQVFAHPKKMESQQWSFIGLNVANCFGNDLSFAQLVSGLKQLQIQQIGIVQKRNSRPIKNECNLKEEISRYLFQPIRLLKATEAQKIWKYRQIYLQSKRLLDKLSSCEFLPEKWNKIKLVQTLTMNQIICCFKLQIYEKALQKIHGLNKIIQSSNPKSLNQLQFLRKIVLLKMGCRLNVNPENRENSAQKSKQSDLSDKTRKDKILCFKIIAFDKKSLLVFIEQFRNKQQSISVQNCYNLALACKKHKQFQYSRVILRKIIELKQNAMQGILKSKCLILLSEIEEESGNLIDAIEALRQMKVEDQTSKNQWYFRKVRLQKMLRIKKASKTCPIFSTQSARKFKLLCDLQNQLNKLKDEKQKNEAIPKKNSCKLYQVISRKKTVKKIVPVPEFIAAKNFDFELKKTTKMAQLSSLKINNYESMQSAQLHTKEDIFSQLRQSETQAKGNNLEKKLFNQPEKQSLTQKYIIQQQQKTLNLNDEPIETQHVESQIKQKLPQQGQQTKVNQIKKKKIAFPIQQDNENQIVSQMIQKGEQKIAYLLLSQAKQSIAPEIQSILYKLFVEKYSPEAQKFIVECINCYRLLGKQNQAVSLLKLATKENKAYGDDPRFKILCLKLLGEVYQEFKDSENALNVYLQLANLGQIQYYDKLGQLYLFKQKYAEAAKCFEIYHEAEKNLYSKSKLAHAYSKTALYKKKALDLLNEMLFANKNFLVFKTFQIQQIQAAQNAVLLLASIYMDLKFGSERAKSICEKFLQVDFSAYPIYYMLGVIYEQQGRKQEAFQKYLTALNLKPSHLPSLIKIVNDIGIGNSHNLEITNILRKAFVQNSRNWQLLQLLMQSITLTKNQIAKPSVQQLVRFAKILQRAEVNQRDMQLQIQIVWTWAFQTLEQRRKKEQVNEDEYQNEINMKLGEIHMAKGNLKASQFYLNKVLAKLESRRKRTVRRRAVMKIQLQALQNLSYIKSRQNQNVYPKRESKEISNNLRDTLFEKQIKKQINQFTLPLNLILF